MTRLEVNFRIITILIYVQFDALRVNDRRVLVIEDLQCITSSNHITSSSKIDII